MYIYMYISNLYMYTQTGDEAEEREGDRLLSLKIFRPCSVKFSIFRGVGRIRFMFSRFYTFFPRFLLAESMNQS